MAASIAASFLEYFKYFLGSGNDAVSIGVDATQSEPLSDHQIVNDAAQAVADTLAGISAVTGLFPSAPTQIISFVSGGAATVAYFTAFGTNTVVLGDDIADKKASPVDKSLSILGDIVTEVGDVIGHWATLGSFAFRLEAIPFQATAEALTIGGLTINGLKISNRTIPPIVGKLVATAQTALADGQFLVNQFDPIISPYLGASAVTFLTDLGLTLGDAAPTLSSFGTGTFLTNATAFYGQAQKLESDAINLFASIGPQNTSLTATATNGLVSFSDNTGELTGVANANPTPQNGISDFGSGSVTATNTTSDDTTEFTNQFQTTAGGDVLSSETETIPADSVTQGWQLGPNGQETQTTNFYGFAIATQSNEVPVIISGTDDTSALSIPSSTPSNNVILSENADGFITISVGNSQQIVAYLSSKFLSDSTTIDVSNAGSTVDIATEIGDGDTAVIATNNDVANVVQGVHFGDPDGTLVLAEPTTFTSTIYNFLPGDTIDLVDILASNETITSSGVLIVAEASGSPFQFQLDPSKTYTNLAVFAESDSNGGSDIVATAPDSVSDGQSITVSSTVETVSGTFDAYNTYEATVSLSSTDIQFGSARYGEQASQTVPITVSYVGGNLNPNLSADSISVYLEDGSTYFQGTPEITNLGPDYSPGAIDLSVDTSSLVGDIKQQIPLVVAYDDRSTTIDLTATLKVYQPAVALYTDPSNPSGTSGYYAFPIIHFGQTGSTEIDITNTTTGDLADSLIINPGTSGAFSVLNGLTLGAGETGTATVTITGDVAGSVGADQSLFTPLTHDDALPDAAAAGSIFLDGVVYNYAQPVLVDAEPGTSDFTSGGVLLVSLQPSGGTLTQNGDNSYTLDLGTIDQTTATIELGNILVENATPSNTLSDYLSGSISVSGVGLINDVETTVSQVAAPDGFFELGDFQPDVYNFGTHTVTVTYTPTSVDSGGTSSLPAITLTVIDDITLPSISGATISGEGKQITIDVGGGQNSVIDPILPEAADDSITIQGPGTADVESSDFLNRLEVGLGSNVAIIGSELGVPSATLDNGSNISGYGEFDATTLANGGVITASGGTLDIGGAAVTGTGTLSIMSGAALLLEGNVAADESILFTGAAETLILGANILAPISGFTNGDTISVEGQVIDSAAYNPTNGSLVVTPADNVAYTLDLVGSYQQSDFGIANGEIQVSLNGNPNTNPGSGSGTTGTTGSTGTTGGSVNSTTFVVTATGAATMSAGQTGVIDAVAGPVSITGNAAASETIVASAGPFTFTAGTGSGTVNAGGANDDIYLPGGGSWALALGTGSHTVVAATGNDTVNTGTNGSLVFLGAGATSVASSGADTIIGGAGSATINAMSTPLYFGASGATLFNALGAAATLVGGGSETVSANSAAMLVFGGSGGLFFNAGSGSSTVVSYAGGGTLQGGSASTLYFGIGPTTYNAGTAVDTIVGYGGAMTATGGSNGTLFFTGTTGGNDLFTGDGASTIIGFGTGDTYNATGGANTVIEAAGVTDTINGSQSTGSNSFFAFGNNDVVIGGTGSTAIQSAFGNQTLIAGSGATLFNILAGTPNRAITIDDFNAANDYVKLQGYAAGTGTAALQTAITSGNSQVLTLPDGTTVTFEGITNLSSSSLL